MGAVADLLCGTALPARRNLADLGRAEAQGIVMKKMRRRELLPQGFRRQQDVLCYVMLSAGQCEMRRTLHEPGPLTGCGEASVSAPLRHFAQTGIGSYEATSGNAAWTLCDRPRRFNSVGVKVESVT
jgi:hypothetical protein